MSHNILTKYNQRGPRYTSYPTAAEFHEGLTWQDLQTHLVNSNTVGSDKISLYFHIPFCPKLCHFCGCHTHLSTREKVHSDYTEIMLREVENTLRHLDEARPVTQIHWGGGTPNSINLSLIEKIMGYIQGTRKIDPTAEVAIECNPAHLDTGSVKQLAGMGFNRISLGIQDFNPEVLRAVNRDPSRIPLAELIPQIRESGISGINLDFIYGLPLQTVDSFLETIERAAALRPDRLVTFSYAHVPWVKKSQKIIEAIGFPDESTKLNMLVESAALLKSQGYTIIGIDHYALPDDSLALAKRNHTLHRNFQGYCTRDTTGQVYAFGASAITQLETAYFQNFKETKSYQTAVMQNGYATFKGYILTREERIIRSVITEVMCNARVNFTEIAQWNDASAEEVRRILNYQPQNFREMEEDGLVIAKENEVIITPAGEFLARVVALKLDPKPRNPEVYSKII